MEDFLKDVLGYLAPSLAAIVAAAIAAGLVLALKKLGVDVSKAEADRLKDEIADVVEAVEEIAKAEEAKGSKPSPEAKLAMAVSKVKVKFPRVKPEVVKDIIHAVLPRLALGALGKAAKLDVRIPF